MPKIFALSLALSLCFVLPACQQTASNLAQDKLLVAPVSPEYQKEISLAKLSEILTRSDISNEQRARFLYERGILFDSVGLRMLARIDFYQALKIQPNLSDIYNFLGIYFTQDGQFEQAFEAFDGVLELEPNYEYAYLNRGIALYYAQRPELALDDLQAFYQKNPQDGYRALWLYLIEQQLSPDDSLAHLASHRELIDNNKWVANIIDFYLGRIDKSTLFETAKANLSSMKEYSERLCELYFYLAKQDMLLGNYDQAANYLRLALATNIYDFVEHRYAQRELQVVLKLKQQKQKTTQ